MAELGEAMVRFASKHQMKETAARGDREAQQDLAESNELEKTIMEHNEMLQEARNGNHAAAAHLFHKVSF